MSNFSPADFFPLGLAYGQPGPSPAAVRGAGGRRYLLGRMAEALGAGLPVCCTVADDASREALRGALRQLGVHPPPDETEGQPEERLFHDYGFAAVVGLWLEHGRFDAARLLSPHISTEGFVFTAAEFVDLRQRVDAARRHFGKLPAVPRALDDLNTGLFRFQEITESQEFVVSHVARFLDRARVLHRRYVLALNGHARSAYFAAVGQLAARQDALAAAAGTLRRARSREGRPAKRELQAALRQLGQYREAHPDPERPAPARPEEIDTFLTEEGLRLTAELTELPRKLQSDALSLSALTAGDEALEALHAELTGLIRDIDEAGLYQLPLSGQYAATTPRQLKLLEQVIDRLADTESHLGSFPDFHRRRQYWYAQPAHLRRLLGPLLELPPVDWDTAFQAWYLEHCLLRATKLPAPPLDPNHLATVADRWLEATPLPEAAWTELLRFDRPEQAELHVDLTGTAEAADLRLLPFADSRAAAFRLAGVRHSELAFQQFFAALRPPNFRAGAQVQAPSQEPVPRFHQEADGSVTVFLPRDADYDNASDFTNNWPRYVSAGRPLTVYHDWSGDRVTHALLSDGISAKFLAAVLIRALEYGRATPFDAGGFTALGAEVRGRYRVDRPENHPLAESVARLLRPRLPGYFVETAHPWRDVHLPALVTGPDGRKTVLLPHGRLGSAEDGLVTEALRQRELRNAGYRLVVLDAGAFWAGPERAVEELISVLR